MSTLSFPHRKRDPFRPPEAPGLGRGLIFAIAAHVALVIAISANVQWRTKTLPTAEAELWSAVPQAAAPREELPPPDPEPKPQPKPEPPPPPQPTAEDIQAQRDAEIAIAKAKDQKQREAERLAELEEQKKLKARKDKLDKQKADDKARADKLEKDMADKAKLDKQAKDKAEKAEKDRETKALKDADAKRESQRQENLKRMMGMAGATGGANATGTALKSSGPSSTYGGRVVARVRPNIVYADNPAGNPAAEVEVRVAPDGTIIGRKLIKSSGLPEWDNAVLRAIDKTEQLPRDTDGSVPSSLVISFKPKDL